MNKSKIEELNGIAPNRNVSSRWSEDEKKALQFWLWNEASESKDDYESAADYLNQMFNKGRTATACRAMDRRINGC